MKVIIDWDEAYPVYWPRRTDSYPQWGTQVDVTVDTYRRWLAVQKAFKDVQAEMAAAVRLVPDEEHHP